MDTKQEIVTEASTQAATEAAAQATIPCSLHDLPMYGECFWSLNNRGEYSLRAPECNGCGINCKEQNALQQQLLAEFYKMREGEKRQDIKVSPFAKFD